MFARFFSPWICVIAFPLGAAQKASAPIDAQPAKDALHCVDPCLLEFSRLLGRHLTRADVAAARRVPLRMGIGLAVLAAAVWAVWLVQRLRGGPAAQEK